MATEQNWLCGPGAEHPAVQIISGRFPEAQVDKGHFRGEIVWTVKPETLLDFMRFIKDDPQLEFKFLVDVGGLEAADGSLWTFYNVHSLKIKVRMRIKVPVSGKSVPSVTPLFPGANWHERETFDLFGIEFTGHPNLTRIFMPDDFQGHPLLKSFPLRGRD